MSDDGLVMFTYDLILSDDFDSIQFRQFVDFLEAPRYVSDVDRQTIERGNLETDCMVFVKISLVNVG